MDDADWARTRMISDVEPNHKELIWFDRQMFWQIAGSTVTLYGTAGGAFILACEKHNSLIIHTTHTERSQSSLPLLVSAAGLGAT